MPGSGTEATPDASKPCPDCSDNGSANPRAPVFAPTISSLPLWIALGESRTSVPLSTAVRPVYVSVPLRVNVPPPATYSEPPPLIGACDVNAPV